MDVAAGNWALKEWAVIVHALLEGEQILDVRKGGLREDGRHFSVQANRLWLYPTAEHQKPELLKEPYRHWIDLAHAAPVGEPITLEGWADVVKVATVTSQEELDAIASKLIWTSDYAASRLGWKHRDPLWVLALRVHRLDEPVTVDWADDYGGCTSWVELAGLPDPTAVPSHAGAVRRGLRSPAQGRGRGPPVAHRRGRLTFSRTTPPQSASGGHADRCGWYPRLRASASVSGPKARNVSAAITSATFSSASASSTSRS